MKNIRSVLRFILAGLGVAALVLPWAACSDPFGKYNNSNDPSFSAGTVTTVLVVIPTTVSPATLTTTSTTSSTTTVVPLIQTVLGGGVSAVASGPQGTSVAISEPLGIAVNMGNANEIFIALKGSNRIVKVLDSGQVQVISGGGNMVMTTIPQEPFAAAHLESVHAISMSPAGFFVTDTTKNVILKTETGFNWTEVFSGIPTYMPFVSNPPRLNTYVGFIPDIIGTGDAVTPVVYYVEYNSHTIRKIEGNAISTFAGTLSSPGSDNSRLNSPEGIAIDFDSTRGKSLYVADTLNHRIQQFRLSDGVFLATVAGTGSPGSSGDNNAANTAQLNNPSGIAVDQLTGDLYIADTVNDRIRKVAFDTRKISTVAGGGSFGTADGILATNATLNIPKKVAVARVGSASPLVLYISDTENDLVRKVTF